MDVLQGEKQLLELQEMLESQPDSADILREELKKSVIQIIQDSDELSPKTQELVLSIIKTLGVNLREVFNDIIEFDGDDNDGDYEFDDDSDDTGQLKALYSDWILEGMPTVKVFGDFVPADEGKPRPANHFTYGIPRTLDDFPRIEMLKKILHDLNILEKNCRSYEPELDEETHDVDKKNRKKKNHYKAIVIPELEKIVLICNKEGNATFVIRAKMEDAEKYYRMKKSELKMHPNVKFFPWKIARDWVDDLKNILLSCSPRAYFKAENASRIKRELEAFAAQVGGGIDVKRLDEWLFPATKIVDEDGNLRRGDDYIAQAALEMGIVINTLKIPQYEVKHRLLQLAGIIK